MKEKRILIVDDEVPIRNLFCSALEQKGYQAQSAGSAEEALKLVTQQKYGIYFLDLNLPGMNGIDLCRAILKIQPDARAYAITGYTSSYKSDDCLKAGFKDYFTKPVSLHVLFEIAEKNFKD